MAAPGVQSIRDLPSWRGRPASHTGGGEGIGGSPRIQSIGSHPRRPAGGPSLTTRTEGAVPPGYRRSGSHR